MSGRDVCRFTRKERKGVWGRVRYADTPVRVSGGEGSSGGPTHLPTNTVESESSPGVTREDARTGLLSIGVKSKSSWVALGQEGKAP